jgi:ankyrin repeat protein
MFFRSFASNPTVVVQPESLSTRKMNLSTLLTTIKNNDLYAFKSVIQTNNINLNDTELLDPYKNSILHIATINRANNIVKYLLDKNVDQEKVNLFDETALDIAIKNNDTKLVKMLTSCDKEKVGYLEKENKRLDEKVKELETDKTKLLDTNKMLTMKNNYLQVQLNEEKQSKRKYIDLESENKKLKTDNESLQKTVRTLKDLAKK